VVGGGGGPRAGRPPVTVWRTVTGKWENAEGKRSAGAILAARYAEVVAVGHG